ncbi:MAG: hypothetical protein L6Q59_14930 [Ignavibacteriaceae bacterium]|nr:hypothetical protein [Ignavibacteriaceae bacterium]
MELKKKITVYLFFVTILLVAANALTERFISGRTEKAPETDLTFEKYPFSAEKLDSLLASSLRQFSIPDKYLTRGKAPKNGIVRSYKIGVPADLPLIIFLQYLYSSLSHFDIPISGTEVKRDLESVIELKTEEGDLKVTVTQLEKITRDAGEISIILSGYPELTPEMSEEILNQGDVFTLLLKPNRKNSVLINHIKESGKDYLIQLDEESEDIEYKIGKDYSKRRLQLVIYDIIRVFPSDSVYTIDHEGVLYNSTVFPFVRDEFEKRGAGLLATNRMKKISGSDSTEVTASFRSQIKNLKPAGKMIILMQASDYLFLNNEIKLLKRKGVKFLPVSKILK